MTKLQNELRGWSTYCRCDFTENHTRDLIFKCLLLFDLQLRSVSINGIIHQFVSSKVVYKRAESKHFCFLQIKNVIVTISSTEENNWDVKRVFGLIKSRSGKVCVLERVEEKPSQHPRQQTHFTKEKHAKPIIIDFHLRSKTSSTVCEITFCFRFQLFIFSADYVHD